MGVAKVMEIVASKRESKTGEISGAKYEFFTVTFLKSQ